jgi:hypothetical protein
MVGRACRSLNSWSGVSFGVVILCLVDYGTGFHVDHLPLNDAQGAEQFILYLFDRHVFVSDFSAFLEGIDSVNLA